jgi:ubiquinone/menaquinone biosynthesis C-methylase UbiE
MDLIDRLRELATRLPRQIEHIQTEEATKNALILPFIAALGYNVFDPTEVTPELNADVGVKKGEKVDYAILKDGKPIILFECKHHATDLAQTHASQLYRYFSVTDARFSVLTNGIVYWFYTDLDAPNKMDAKPFFEFNLLDIRDGDVDELKKFSKSAFDLNHILTTASELKFTERYTHGYETQFVEYLEGRTTSANAAFFVPHLRPGMSLLDCGCGPGSITAGLASIVTPGQVVGIDIEESQIKLARAQAETQVIPNVRFEVANLYDIPFPDETFDAAFAHTVLQHLADPVRALREIYRVLKPGGVVGVREEDTAGVIFAPTNALMEQTMALYVRSWHHNGGDPYFARRHRAVLRAAGFVRIEGSASAECYGTPAATQSFGKVLSGYFVGHLETAVKMGWMEQETLSDIGRAWEEWGRHPDAYFAMLRCEAVGWKQ